MISTNIKRHKNYTTKKQSTKQFLLFQDRKGKDNELVQAYAAMTGCGFAIHSQREIEFSTFILIDGFDGVNTKTINLPKDDKIAKTKFVVQPTENSHEFIIHSLLTVGTCNKTEFKILCRNLPGICHFEINDRYSIKVKIGQAFRAEEILENLCGLISVFNLDKNFFV